MISLLILGLAMVQLASVNRQSIIVYLKKTKAKYIAEAGIDFTINNYILIDEDRNLSEFGSDKIIDKHKLGDGYFSVYLIGGSNSDVMIQSTGFCRGVKANMVVKVSVDWETDIPAIKSIRYKKDTLLTIQ